MFGDITRVGANFHAMESLANLKRVNFKNANLNGATFSWSIIRHAIMDGSTAFKADFRKTKIKKTNLKLVKFCQTLMPYGIDNSGCDK